MWKNLWIPCVTVSRSFANRHIARLFRTFGNNTEHGCAAIERLFEFVVNPCVDVGIAFNPIKTHID